MTFLAVMFTVVSAAPAQAHAIVERTEPAIDAVVDVSPDRVVMHFNEPVEVTFGAIRVYDTLAHRVDNGNVDHVEGDASSVRVGLKPDLQRGTYTVTWRVLSADAHVISEAFVFHVGAPGKKPQGIAQQVLAGQEGAGAVVGAIFAVVRVVSFASLLALTGALLFLSYVWHTSQGEGGPAAFFVRWRRIAWIAWVALLAATLISLPLQGAQAAGLSLGDAFGWSTLQGVAGTRFGRLMLARAGFLLIAAGLWWWLKGRTVKKDAVVEAAGGFIILGALVTTALAGHAGSTSPVAVNVAIDTLHLAAVGTWLGGLLVLVAAALPAFRAEGSPAAVVSRYSDVALVAVAVIVLTGLWQSFVEVRALHALTGTTYGWTLLAKLAVFVPLVGLGAINNRWAKPRIEAAGAQAERGISVLRRLVTIEVALGLVVVAITALLVNLPPARVSAGIEGPYTTQVAFGEDELDVLVDPNQVGENEVHFTVTSPTGAAVAIKEMRVLFTMPAESIGPIVADGERLAKGHFVVQGNQLSVPGRWTLEVVARIGRFDEVRARVPVTVNG